MYNNRLWIFVRHDEIWYLYSGCRYRWRRNRSIRKCYLEKRTRWKTRQSKESFKNIFLEIIFSRNHWSTIRIFGESALSKLILKPWKGWRWNLRYWTIRFSCRSFCCTFCCCKLSCFDLGCWTRRHGFILLPYFVRFGCSLAPFKSKQFEWKIIHWKVWLEDVLTGHLWSTWPCIRVYQNEDQRQTQFKCLPDIFSVSSYPAGKNHDDLLRAKVL